MSYCPNCGVEVAADAPRCTSCSAIFDGDWKPLDAPPVPKPESRGARVAYGITKFVLVALSLAALGSGASIAHVEHDDRWTVVGIIAMLAAIFVAIRAKVRWSFLVLFASLAFGLASCFANFHWHGG